jgi:hypothetical protein
LLGADWSGRRHENLFLHLLRVGRMAAEHVCAEQPQTSKMIVPLPPRYIPKVFKKG